MDFSSHLFQESCQSNAKAPFFTRRRRNVWRDGRKDERFPRDTYEKTKRSFPTSTLFTETSPCVIRQRKRYVITYLNEAREQEKSWQRVDKQTFTHVEPLNTKFQENCALRTFFSFAPNPYSNATSWNVRTLPANVRSLPANLVCERANVACKRANVGNNFCFLSGILVRMPHSVLLRKLRKRYWIHRDVHYRSEAWNSSDSFDSSVRIPSKLGKQQLKKCNNLEFCYFTKLFPRFIKVQIIIIDTTAVHRFSIDHEIIIQLKLS